MRIPYFILLTLLPLSCLASSSLVDLLSTSPDHSLLLRAFQRARLIPVLNQLNGSTLFAPTNEAIRSKQKQEQEEERGVVQVWSSLDSTSSSSSSRERDNLELELRETLLYHCLNYTLLIDPSIAPNSSSSSTINIYKPPPYQLLPIDRVVLQETLYYPSLSSFNDSFPHPPSLPGSPPDKDSPSFPENHPKGLLYGQGQKLRLVRRRRRRRKSSEIEGKELLVDKVWIGVDSKGNDGIPVNSNRVEWAKNGVLIPISGTLSRPKNLYETIQLDPSLTIFNSLLPEKMVEYLKKTSHLTLFAPTNEAWESLSELEMRYLKSQFSELDLKEILQDSSTRRATSITTGGGGQVVGYLEKIFSGKARHEEDQEVFIKNSRNGTLQLERLTEGGEGDVFKVNGTEILQGDILASNGVLHTLPSLLLPSGSLALTAEKYLLALNCSKFVELLHSVNMSRYVTIPSKDGQDGTTIIQPNPLPHIIDSQIVINRQEERKQEEETKKGYTILALKDDLFSSSSFSMNSLLTTLPSFPSPGSKQLEFLLSYHILPLKWLPKQLKDGMLIGTELKPSDGFKDDERQKLIVSVQSEQGGKGEGWEKRKGDDDGKEVILGFGNANAIAEPVEVGNSIIYLISTILEPPVSIISTAVSDLRLSTFIASIYSCQLSKTFLSSRSITYLIPTNLAFENLGLVMSYLLLPSSEKELEITLRYHAIDELVYRKDFPPPRPPQIGEEEGSNEKKFPTLEIGGSEIYLERGGRNTSVCVHGPTISGFRVNGQERDGKIISEIDTLTSTGVYHVIDQVELPPTLDISLEKLLKGGKSTLMIELIRKANLSWVLNGNSSRTLEDGGKAFTILCPTDKALSRLNLTFYENHPQQLENLIKLHIIPTDAIFPPPTSSSSHSYSSSNIPPDQKSGEEEEGTPLRLTDSIVYSTLHSRQQGGQSKHYGSVAFKKWGTERGSWLVGISGARGTKGESDSARVINWGRATPRISSQSRQDESLVSTGDDSRLLAGGGVILIDSVLLPWEPGWFRKWGWIVLSVLVGVLVFGALGFWGVKKWKRRLGKNGEGYERVEGEED